MFGRLPTIKKNEDNINNSNTRIGTNKIID